MKARMNVFFTRTPLLCTGPSKLLQPFSLFTGNVPLFVFWIVLNIGNTRNTTTPATATPLFDPCTMLLKKGGRFLS